MILDSGDEAKIDPPKNVGFVTEPIELIKANLEAQDKKVVDVQTISPGLEEMGSAKSQNEAMLTKLPPKPVTEPVLLDVEQTSNVEIK